MARTKKTTRKAGPAKAGGRKNPARKAPSAASSVGGGKRRTKIVRRRAAEHDPEQTVKRGMTAEAAAEDEAETMASTGDSEGTFINIVTGTATGLGIDRGESIGTGGLSAGEDLDEVAEGDYWRQNFERRPYYQAGRSYDEPGYRLGSAQLVSGRTRSSSKTSRPSCPGNGPMSLRPAKRIGRTCVRPSVTRGTASAACAKRSGIGVFQVSGFGECAESLEPRPENPSGVGSIFAGCHRFDSPGLPGKEVGMLWTIFVVLLVLWLLGFFAFHVTSGFIHLVLVVAVIVLILGLVRRGP